MFKQLVDVVRQTLFLLRDVEENQKDIATIKEQLVETNQLVRQLALEFRHLGEHEQQEREKLMLKLENVLLRFERQLPPAKGTRKPK